MVMRETNEAPCRMKGALIHCFAMCAPLRGLLRRARLRADFVGLAHKSDTEAPWRFITCMQKSLAAKLADLLLLRRLIAQGKSFMTFGKV